MISSYSDLRRLFIALWPDDDIRTHIYGYQQTILSHESMVSMGSPVRPENLHLTLRFLGAVNAISIEPLCQQLASIRCAPFSVQLNRLGYFDRSRILWLGLTQTPAELTSLVTQVDMAVSKILPSTDDPVEKFTPHVSLFRKATRAIDVDICKVLHWQVNDFAIVESLQAEGGVMYRVRNRWSLQ